MENFARIIYENKYKKPGEDWVKTCWRVVQEVFSAVDAPRPLVEATAQTFIDRKAIPGGRYLYAAGLPVHQVNNCSLYRAEDSREGWANLFHKAGMSLMTGAGIGVVYSDIREEGALICGTGGIATGPIALMQIINEMGRGIMQGGSRRSAIWAGLHWNHPDIEKFIHLKNWIEEVRGLKARDFNFPATMDMTNISVILDDEFFEAYHNNEHPKHVLASTVYWETIERMLKTSEPGFSIDIGENAGENLRNACVPYDTEILTEEGYQKIGDLEGQPVKVWNGEEWSQVTPCITGENQPILRVTLSSGRSLSCTLNHEFITAVGYTGDTIRIQAKDLTEGEKLAKFDFPVIEGGKHIEYAYAQGFLSAEGMDDHKFTWVYPPKFPCLERLKASCRNVRLTNKNTYSITWDFDQHPKSFVPFHWSIQSRLDWIAGLLDGDGTQLKEGGAQIGSVDRQFIVNLQKFLTTLGVNSKFSLCNEAGNKVLPDGKGGSKEYYCQDFWRLCIGAVQIQHLKSLGMKCERLPFKEYPQRDNSRFETIVSIEDAGIADKVYCFTEPKAHRGCFEGIVTGQCTEITSRDDSDICNLLSVNMAQVRDLKEMERVVSQGTAFAIAGSVYSDVPHEEIRAVREKNRRIGVGLMGLHEWLLQRGKKYGPDAELEEYLKVYRDATDTAAKDWARTWNLSEPVKKRAIAPTGSISILAGPTTSGIEPLLCASYMRRFLKHKTWCEEYVIEPIAKRLVAQGVAPEDIEDAYTIDTERRLEFQAWVQQYVDHAISSTINLPAWGTEKNNKQTLQYYGNLFLKYLPRLRGLTCYADGSRSGQPLTPVPYDQALRHTEKFGDVCSVSGKGGTCGS